MKAQVCGKKNMLLRDRNDLNSDPDDLIERLAETLELYDLARMAAEALSDAGVRPPESDTGLQGHQPMSDLTETEVDRYASMNGSGTTSRVSRTMGHSRFSGNSGSSSAGYQGVLTDTRQEQTHRRSAVGA